MPSSQILIICFACCHRGGRGFNTSTTANEVLCGGTEWDLRTRVACAIIPSFHNTHPILSLRPRYFNFVFLSLSALIPFESFERGMVFRSFCGTNSQLLLLAVCTDTKKPFCKFPQRLRFCCRLNSGQFKQLKSIIVVEKFANNGLRMQTLAVFHESVPEFQNLLRVRRPTLHCLVAMVTKEYHRRNLILRRTPQSLHTFN